MLAGEGVGGVEADHLEHVLRRLTHQNVFAEGITNQNWLQRIMLLQKGIAKKNTTAEGIDQSIRGCAAEADRSEYFCRAGLAIQRRYRRSQPVRL